MFANISVNFNIFAAVTIEKEQEKNYKATCTTKKNIWGYKFLWRVKHEAVLPLELRMLFWRISLMYFKLANFPAYHANWS